MTFLLTVTHCPSHMDLASCPDFLPPVFPSSPPSTQQPGIVLKDAFDEKSVMLLTIYSLQNKLMCPVPSPCLALIPSSVAFLTHFPLVSHAESTSSHSQVLASNYLPCSYISEPLLLKVFWSRIPILPILGSFKDHQTTYFSMQTLLQVSSPSL